MYPFSLWGILATCINFRSRDKVDCVICTPLASRRAMSSSCDEIYSERIIFRMIERRCVF